MLGEDAPFWDELGALLGAPPLGPPPRAPLRPASSRTAAARASPGVAGDLFSSGETVLVAVADVPRRRAGLEAVVAGLSDGPMPVTSWGALAARPGARRPLRPPRRARPAAGRDRRSAPAQRPSRPSRLGAGRGRVRDHGVARRARSAPAAHGGLPRPARAAARRTAADLETALRGTGRYPRNARACARLATVLGELGLIELDPARADLPRPRRRSKRPRALRDLPRQPRRTHGNRARPGARAAPDPRDSGNRLAARGVLRRSRSGSDQPIAVEQLYCNAASL